MSICNEAQTSTEAAVEKYFLKNILKTFGKFTEP